MPKVSVIIPVYNVEQYLRECLDSVVNQTLKDIEIICVDDGSTDSSLEILKEYAAKDERFIILEQKNKGAGVARNKGLEVASGEYLSFLDSDDIFNSNMLEQVYINALEYNSDVVCFQYSYLNNITGSIDVPTGIFPPNSSNHKIQTFTTEYLQDMIFTVSNPMPWNKLISRQLVIENNIKYQSLTHSNDIYFTMSCLAFAGKITFIWESYVLYRYNRADSLKNTRDDNPFCFYEAYNELYNTLVANNLFDKYKISFFNSLVSSTYWTYRHTENRKSDVKTFAMQKIIPQFGLNIEENKNLLSKTNINAIESICRKNEIILSLTSYPARIDTVNQAIESLLNQSMKADRVILWLAEEQFPNKEKDLPKQLLDLVPKGLTIDWCKDIKSYKKLIPALNKYSNNIIVTADDDVIYDKKWLEQLYISYVHNPDYIHCHRAHYVKFDQKNILPYKKWKQNISNVKPSYNNFFTGVGGILYPPNCFHKDILREDLFMELCPHGDDIWFWAMCVLNNKKINVVTGKQKLKYVEGTQDTALWLSNVNEGKNDIQIKNIIKHYPKLLKKLDKENGFYKNKFEKLFSVKNDDKRKVITILGVKFKLKSKKLIKRQDERKKNEKLNKILSLQESTNKKIESIQKELFRLKDINNQLITQSTMLLKQYELQNYIVNLTKQVPKLSIIIPVYNTSSYLKECLDSVTNQTLIDIEIICIDDGSTDDSLNILNEYAENDKRIIVVSQEHKGVGSARNIGLNVAKGKYIGFLDSDDYIDSNYYDCLYNAALKYNADIAKASYKYFNNNSEWVDDFTENLINNPQYQNHLLNVNDHSVVIWNSIYKRDFLIKNNIMYFDNINHAEDILFTARTSFLANIITPVKNTYYHYRRGRLNQLSSNSLEKIFNQLKANILTTDFLNTVNSDAYADAYKRCIWRCGHIFEEGLCIPEFNAEYQKDYITSVKKIIEKYKGNIEDILSVKINSGKCINDLLIENESYTLNH